ncbi:DNA-directed RNA polymerase subunit omega [Clostridiisalibacter paucivorans]|uniref:DNA-directed RNA polymerase subunit omega n=1 Tax=Clostridiisalibacter paucivorans TaxID=408753 RepID=UPI000479C65A|nr:DNA-directed RNA polymerase subunit omega [Clostridiisalibacter paucivorans]
MVSPSIDELLEKVDSRYTLIMMVSKRARQLVEHNTELVDETKPVILALKEVAEDKVNYTRPKITGIK